MKLHACGVGCLSLAMLAAASLWPWVPAVGQSGGAGVYPSVLGDSFFIDFSTGHYYEVVTSEPLSWPEAKAAAESGTFLGVHGHLATLTSGSESFWVEDHSWWALGGGSSNCWIGGFQAEGSTEPDGGWQWVTGEPWDYTDWGSGKPDDLTGDEKYLTLFWEPLFWEPLPVDPLDYEPSVVLLGPKWDDSADMLAPYVVEYEPPPLVVVVGIVEKFIRDLPDEAFDRSPRQRRRQLANLLAPVERMLSKEDYSAASGKLASDILPRVGGQVSSTWRSPWIVDADAQEQLATLVGDLIRACRLRSAPTPLLYRVRAAEAPDGVRRRV